MLVSEVVWGPLIRLGSRLLLKPGTKIKPGKPANVNKSNPPEVKAQIDKLTTPRSKDAIEYSKALKGQKIDKFNSTGDVSHLKGLSPSEAWRAAEKIKPGSGTETLRKLFPSKPKGK
jgi:hypothetical protein